MTDRTHGTAGSEEVTLWVDPVCAWTWITYKWLREAASVRPLSLSVRPTGLGYLQGAPGLDKEHARFLELAPGPVRVLAAAAAGHGAHVVGPLYEAVARRFHGTGGLYEGLHERVRGLSGDAKREVQASLLEQARDVIGDALTECGLPAGLAAATGSAEWDEDLRTAHASIPRDGAELDVIGVPVIAVDGRVGVFGPVLRSAPAGERAGALWDGFAALVREDSFLELRRVTPRPVPAPAG
ncbi:mycothiol-dependent nitroreductase Rv2466c family protein [Streptomyces sp. ALB3]|uniref:mycothiol-dependent nitroreductase Rv2466c family protein n=1 Tax=Streptomyces sp. ALB3 TaxID=3374278 RepID=UPI00379FE53E